MMMYAALLRGINVSGHKKIPMAELRTLLTELGHGDVRTHLQSGNAVFSSESDDQNALAAELEHAIAQRFGFDVPCLVRDGGYLAAVVDACPFPAAELQARELHVTYFDQPVDAARFAPLNAAAFLPEEFRLGERVLYLHAPGGLGGSKLAAALSRPTLIKGLVATSRNWNTVTRLAEMTGGTT
ncbi:DUF1697 domain-containing protein [Streptomyces brevispora]|uniref:DUF1697 domain-containing protein n=1 Tax=Streptomyces brevispora TaxID=887462 RepID=A0A561V4I9_9ACTN|nr:DUF1697 domain-containing protein [Streptomyces brevispora]TWG06527.1 uncharacterized protein (DUF1697 family) [Streptomyces brevispora]WSC12562.1 DUF1697 domain-containing protein [Streptomyces brevispora]